MEIIVNDSFPIFFRAPPRTPLQLINVLKVFESVDGASWGFVKKLNKTQTRNRLYVAENLQTRGISTKPFALVRNYFSSLEKLGLVYINEKKELILTSAAKSILNETTRAASLLEQFIKYKPLRFDQTRSVLRIQPSNPFYDSFKIWFEEISRETKKGYYTKMISENRIRTEVFPNHPLQTSKVYSNTMFTLLEETTILYYLSGRGYSFLLDKVSASEFLYIFQEINDEFWEPLISKEKELPYPEFMIQFGETKNLGRLSKFIIDGHERSKKIIHPQLSLLEFYNFEHSTRKTSKQPIERKVSAQTDYTKKQMGKSILLEAVQKMAQEGIRTKYVNLSFTERNKDLVSSSLISVPEQFNDEIYISTLNDEESSILSKKFSALIQNIQFATKEKPLMVFSWDFDDSAKWLFWNLNKTSWLGYPLCVIPIEFAKLRIITQISESDKQELIQLLLSISDNALSANNYEEWDDFKEKSINNYFASSIEDKELTDALKLKKEHHSVKKLIEKKSGNAFIGKESKKILIGSLKLGDQKKYDLDEIIYRSD